MSRRKHTEDISVSMLRCIVNLGETLNLSKTSEQSGLTRQTVRRHITDLESILGTKIFEVHDRKYELSPQGREYIIVATKILEQIDTLTGRSSLNLSLTGGLEKIKFVDADSREFLSQQHAVSHISELGVPLLSNAFAAWGASLARIEHENWAAFRPYSVVYRKSPLGWVFADVGPDSAYAKWFGWAWSKSTAGKLLHEDDAGDDFNKFISQTYNRIYDEGGIRLDHIYAHVPKDGGPALPGTFQRLLLSGIFPDGTAGLSVISAITRNVQIDALSESHDNQVPDSLLMDDWPLK